MTKPGVNALCYLIPESITLTPGDVVRIDGERSYWFVVSVKGRMAYLERLRTPTDVEIHEWIAA